jgi:hypothetical protein
VACRETISGGQAWAIKPQGLNNKSWLGLGMGTLPGDVPPGGAVPGSGLAPWVWNLLRGSPSPHEA